MRQKIWRVLVVMACFAAVTFTLSGSTFAQDISVAFDVKPTSCPNPLNTKSSGLLSAAIVGTRDFDVAQVDLNSIYLEGVAPLRWALEDVVSPFDPSIEKMDCIQDCTTEPADGILDLTLKFDAQEVVHALGKVRNRECIALQFHAALLDGTLVSGEDLVVVIAGGGGVPLAGPPCSALNQRARRAIRAYRELVDQFVKGENNVSCDDLDDAFQNLNDTVDRCREACGVLDCPSKPLGPGAFPGTEDCAERPQVD